jgi:hypothetical protein
MKFLHAAAFAVVLSLASVPVLCAQEPDQDREKPKQQDEEKKKQPSDNEKHKPDDRANAKSQPDKDKPARETERRDQPQRQDDRARQDDRSAKHEQQSNRGDGHRIPDERFRANFGTEHHFHVPRRDDRHFEYGGYAFEYADAWPADWSDDDDVYIVLIGDDYYLVNVRHPEVRLRLMLVD